MLKSRKISTATLLPTLIFMIGIFGSLAITGCGSGDATRDSVTQIIRSSSRPIQSEAKSDTYVIRQRDSIKFEVFGYPEFNAETVIKELGTVTIPNIGEITAAGLTKDQFQGLLKTKLSEYIQGEVRFSLVVISAVPQKITMLGAVTRQENYPLTNEVTLLEALAMAGGVTIDSDLRTINILRGGLSSDPIIVDLTYYVEKGNLESIPLVRPGDTIFVPQTSNVIRELSVFMRDVIFIFGFFQLFGN